MPLFGDPGITYDINLGIIPKLILNRYDIHVIAGYYLFSTQVAFVISLMRSSPYVLYLETHAKTGSDNKAKRVVKDTIKKFAVKHASSYLAVSTWARDYLASYGATVDNIFIMPHLPPISCSLSQAGVAEKAVLRKRHGLLVERPVILWVGRMVTFKRVDILLEACKILENTINAQLVLVGSGPEEFNLRRMQQDLKLDNVSFAGAKTRVELEDFYRLADVFVLPSARETFGAVVPEAMAHGLPVITTSTVGSSADFVVEGRNGFIVPPNDPLFLKNVLKKVLENDRLRERMAHSSLEIMSQYSIEKNAEAFINALDFALKRKS
jgi:glycosyltransferase involved in cell wall biosynthesis